MAAGTPDRLVYSVFHLTDLSKESEVAFAHALAIALTRGSALTLLHAGSGNTADDWRRFPGVRQMLERWGLLEPGSQRSEVFDRFAVQVKKVNLGSARRLNAILDYLSDSPSEMIVATYDARRGVTGVVRDSLTEEVARQSGAMTLFVPNGCQGFVSSVDGSLTLRSILVPIAEDPAPEFAIEAARRVSEWLGAPPVRVTLLHVGDDTSPAIDLVDDELTEYSFIHRDGDVIDEILAVADEIGCDLISMVTNGRSSLGEAVKGSHTERVVRRAKCPVLALPESWSKRG